jgi:NADH-quinone oxidoreductase subunit M
VLDTNILTLITLFPLAGAVIVAFLPRRGKVIQGFTLLVTLISFLLTLHLPAHFIYGQSGFQFEQNFLWITNPAIHYHVGVDGISMWLVVLTGFLAPLGSLASWKAINTRTKEFYFFFLVQQTAMYGVFVSLDLILYYGYWELSLVPMAILIAMHGRSKGSRAAIKFFLYTFTPSALFLVAILALYAKTGTFDYVQLQSTLSNQPGLFGPQALWWISLAFLAAFAVKVPVFPLHGWLGDVFNEAPTAMAMVVAGKLGIYSILRFHLGLFPASSRHRLRRAGRAGAEGHEAAAGVRHVEQSQLLRPRHLYLRGFGTKRRALPHHQRISDDGRDVHPVRPHLRTLRDI